MLQFNLTAFKSSEFKVVFLCHLPPVLGSLSPPSVAVSRLEAALSEVSDLSSTRRQGPAYIWATLERIWLQAGMTSQHMTFNDVFRSFWTGLSWKIRFV